MKAVIMAGGFGTRLRPLTCNVPKPMAPMVNRPMMSHIVTLLTKLGIREVLSLLYYQPEVITTYFGNGSAFGIDMHYVQSEADFGTAGSVRNAYEFLDERFIIISRRCAHRLSISQRLSPFTRRRRRRPRSS